jgi:hypothetical protein
MVRRRGGGKGGDAPAPPAKPELKLAEAEAELAAAKEIGDTALIRSAQEKARADMARAAAHATDYAPSCGCAHVYVCAWPACFKARAYLVRPLDGPT